MHNRVLRAVSAMAVLVPSLAIAQQRPATPPPSPRPGAPAPAPAPRPGAPAQRPATTPAPMMARRRMGPAREHAWQFSIQGGLFSVDKGLNSLFLAHPLAGRIRNTTSQMDFGGAATLAKQLGNHAGLGVGFGFGTGGGGSMMVPTVDLTLSTDINNPTVLFVPIGGSLTQFRGNGNRVTSQFGVHLGLGLLHFVGSGNTALRIEGRMSMDRFAELKTGTSSSGTAYEGQGLVGLSWFFGGAPPRDTDGDGVPDKKDRCANTPRGAIVDANGCPRDSDRDGVPDGLDRCAGTPANTPVDANGCPRDSDGDGVNDAMDRCPNTPAGTPVDANGCPRDADGDGVPDNMDRCANTPRGTPVDANGCPRDSDNDGVPDGADRCPGTPAGTPVDANGCPRDSDNDGVNDAADRCPNTPAGTRVDATGCPLAPDADHDGVEDSKDRCPNTPAGRMVDENGCPLAELPAVGASLVIRNINFVTGRANLTAASQAPLRDIAVSMRAVLRRTPNARFEVGGYTDNRGAAAANRLLSQRRAESVKAAFTTAGVPASALVAVGYGPDSPKAPNTTAAGRAQNRRVEVKRLS